MSQPVRWAVLGTGGIARGVLPALGRARGCVVSAVASRSIERAQSLAGDVGLAHNAACLDDSLPERADVDAVYVTVPNHLHAHWCERLLDAGKHVLCEKPLVATEADARRLAGAAARSGSILAEGFMYLHHDQTARLIELGRTGHDPANPIGRLRAVRAIRGVRQRDLRILSTRLSHAMQGGSLMDLGCYCVSVARLVTGEEPPEGAAMIRASAAWAAPAPGEHASVDLGASFAWTFPSGIVFEGRCSFDSDDGVLLELIGERGTAHTGFPFSPDPQRQVLSISGGCDEIFEHSGDKFVNQFEHFAQAVRGEHAPMPTIDWSVRQARAIERIAAAMGLTPAPTPW